ncbi:MAG: hypothetical protein Kow0092_36220 [Deferrisomatales bacterium]
MVVEQEKAEIYPPEPEDLLEYLPGTDCGSCGHPDCEAFAQAVLARQTPASACPELEEETARVLAATAELDWEPIPYDIMMEQAPCELVEINGPGPDAPLVVTGNFRETVRILTEILERTGSRVFLLPTCTNGYSVDNAVHERMFKASEVLKAMKETEVERRLERPVMLIPGLASSERNGIRQMTRWEVVVGPESGFLLPLFLLENRDLWA